MPRTLSGWTCRVLALPPLPRLKSVYPRGFCGDLPLGHCASTGQGKLTAWRDGVPHELAPPPGRKAADAAMSRGFAVAGHWQSNAAQGPTVWRPDAAGALQPQELPAKGFPSARVAAVAGEVAVGSGKRKGSRDTLALLWQGAQEPVVLPAPEGVEASATATDGRSHVGATGSMADQRAALWEDGRLVAIGPADRDVLSYAQGVGDGEQVGATSRGGLVLRAALWRGSEASHVDLTPAGHVGAEARHCAAGLQVGEVRRRVLHHTDAQGEPPLAECLEHAALWQGTADSFLDLHALVPEDLATSLAHEVRVEGARVRVLGWGQRRRAAAPEDPRGDFVALVWEAEAR